MIVNCIKINVAFKGTPLNTTNDECLKGFHIGDEFNRYFCYRTKLILFYFISSFLSELSFVSHL